MILIISVKRDWRGRVDKTWAAQLASAPYVVKVTSNDKRARVEAWPGSKEQVIGLLGDGFWIEEESEYKIY